MEPINLKKHFKEYLFEGIMIFVAITAGFFAENLREALNENSRNKELMAMLYEDMQADSVLLQNFKTLNQSQIRAIDTLVLMLKTNVLSNLSDLYYYARRSTRKAPLVVNQRTFIQLQNNGGQWFIKDAVLSTKVIAYYERLAIFRANNTNILPEILNLHPYLGKIFDASIFMDMVGSNGKISRPAQVKPLLSTDPTLINQLIFSLDQVRGSFLIDHGRVSLAIDQNHTILELMREQNK